MSSCRHLLALGACALSAAPAFAQTNTPLDQDRVDLNQPVAEPEPEETAPADRSGLTSVEAGNAQAAPIRSIQFIGTQVPEIVANAAQAFIGAPATRDNLQALTKAMSAAYQKSDVALFTVVVPRQDLSTGDLKVAVAEGYIGQVVLEGEVEGRSLKLVRAYAAHLTGEAPLSRRKLERYLSLIRDIPGLKVKSRLELGQGRGAVKLVLTLDYDKPRASLSFDSRSTRLIDEGQVQARAVGYGLLRDGDQTEAVAVAAIDFRSFFYAGLSHSTPIGSNGMRLSLSAGHLETKPSDTSIAGNAETFGLTLSYPVIRSYKRNLTASLAMDGVNSDNTAYGSIIASEKTRAARAALGYSQLATRTSVSAGLTVSKGLDILGGAVPATSGKAGFLKLNARLGFNQSLGKIAVLRLKANGQWSDDPLPAVERFSIGGAEYGRAFERGLISTDKGIATSAELALRPIGKGNFARSEIYGFVDYANVGLVTRPFLAAQDFDLASAGAGIRVAWQDKAMIGFEAARNIDNPYPGYSGEWQFSVNWRLAFRS